MNSLAEVHEKADGILVTAIICIVLSGIAVGLRIFTKTIVKTCYGADDWAIITALLLFYIVEGLQMHGVLQAKKATTPLDPGYKDFWYYAYIGGTMYYLTVMTTNISILFLYRRIFATETFRRISLVMIFINIAWCIPGTLVEIFICTPIKNAWDLTEDGKCITFGTFWLSIVIAELVIDVMILALPIHEIVKLKICWKQKYLVSMMFLLGGLVIITGLVRIPLSYNRHTPAMIDLSEDVLWFNLHLGAAIICACLPTYRPIFKKGSSILSIFRRRYGSNDTSFGESGNSPRLSLKMNQNNDQAQYREIEDQKASLHSSEFSSSTD